MGWALKYFTTHSTAGILDSETDITSVLKGLTVDETVGDEQFIKAGDIKVKTSTKLPFDPAKKNWLSLYRDGDLVNVYLNDEEGLIDDQRYDGVYTYRLKSIQGVFFEDLAKTKLQYDGSSAMWGWALGQGALNIASIQTSSTPSYILNRFGFSLGDILNALSGAHNSSYYKIDTITHPLPTMTNTVPILFRGQSKGTDVDTLQEAVDWTFYSDLAASDTVYWDLTWKHLFELTVFGWNAFIGVRPKFVSNDLRIDIDITPRINVTAGSATTKTWLEREKIYYRHKLDGVKISIKDDEFTQGDVSGSNVLEKSFDVYNKDYNEVVTTGDTKLFWQRGTYRSATVNGYNDYNQSGGWFGTGNVEPYYADMLSDGHSYKGKIIFSGEKTLDQIAVGGDIFQVNRITIDDDGLASIEGIVIS